jgi:dTDP-4-dehydrorhamnose reductase
LRVLVAGANGLLGARLAEELARRGHAVLGVGRGERRAPGAWPYFSADLTEPGQARAAFEAGAPEAVVNAAAQADVDRCEREPAAAFAANVVLPGQLALLARERGAHLVHLSTDYLFSGASGPYAEDAVPEPRGVYALTKHAGEQAVRALAPRWTIARTAVVYGWPAAGRSNFGSWLVTELRAGRPAKVFRDQWITPTLASSAAEMMAELVERRLEGVWHVAGAEAVSRVEFGEALCRIFSLERALLVPTALADAGRDAARPPRAGLRVEKARAELRAKPLSLEEALQRFRAEVEAGPG